MNHLKVFLLKSLYRLCFFKVIVINKTNLNYSSKLTTMQEVDIESQLGQVKILFKEDRRKRRRKLDKMFRIKSFIIELVIPHTDLEKRHEINDKVIIVVKLILSKVNYSILAQVLMDVYLNTIMKNLEDDYSDSVNTNDPNIDTIQPYNK